MENNMLVETHIDLVSRMAKQLMKKNANCDWLTEDDLLGAGFEALVAASRTYDAERNASFKTYAMTCIKNAMLAEIRNMFPIKVHNNGLRTDLVRSDEADGKAKLHELVNLLGYWESEQRRLKETVAELMSHLSHDECWLLRCYYGFDDEAMTLQGIANLLLVSPQAVHKRLKNVHDKLRKLVMDSRPHYRMCA
jgi:RNA polymerase sigma factor (sigma-70 family)